MPPGSADEAEFERFSLPLLLSFEFVCFCFDNVADAVENRYQREDQYLYPAAIVAITAASRKDYLC